MKLNCYLRWIYLLLFCSMVPLKSQLILEKEQISLFKRVKNQDRTMSKEPRVGLVLSGGGARGIAHVGVLKALEKHNIPVDLIVGTSMGSLVGGFYAAGYNSSEIERIVKDINWTDIFSDETDRENLFLGQKLEKDRFLINIRFENWQAELPTSFASGQRVLSIISEKLSRSDYQMIYDFDSLRVPFRAVATDLISGQRIVLSQGDLAEAINASATVPLLFSPVVWDGMLLVDGGLLSNLSTDVAKDLGMDVILVVDITSPLRTRDQLQAPWEIADQVTTIMMQNQYESQINLADVVIEPNLEDIGGTDFGRIDEMISAGESAVDSVIGQIRIKLGYNRSRLNPQTIHYDTFEFRNTTEQKSPPVIPILHAQQSQYMSYNQIEEDVDRLLNLGQFEKVSVLYKDSTLQYQATPIKHVEQLIIRGNKIYPDSILTNLVLPQDSAITNAHDAFSAMMSLKHYYHDRGYDLMKFLGIKQDENRLELNIDEGVVDTITIEGNKRTASLVILRDFPLLPGSAYNTNLVSSGIANIYNTQLFDKVNVNVKQKSGRRILVIKVDEKRYTVLRLGGKVGTERGIQGYYELGDDNFFGTGAKASLGGRYGELDRSVGLNYRTDRIFETFLTFEAQGYYDWKILPYYQGQEKFGEFIEDRLGARVLLGQQLSKLGQMSVELRLENARAKEYTGQFNRPQNSELRTLTIRSITDKRDRIAFTTRGIYNVWYWEAGNREIFEGQENFTKAFVNLEGYYTYWQIHTFHIKGVIGVGDNTLPFTEYFRIGGPKSFIGFHEYELSGRQVIFANFEYRVKSPLDIFSDTFFGLKYDVGGIWETPDLVLTSDDFFSAYGVWLGIDTVLGPIQFSYGNSTLKSGIFYFSLGYDF